MCVSRDSKPSLPPPAAPPKTRHAKPLAFPDLPSVERERPGTGSGPGRLGALRRSGEGRLHSQIRGAHSSPTEGHTSC